MTSLLRVVSTFEEISQVSGRLEKERLLRTLQENPEVEEIAKTLLVTALGWYNHYGIRTLQILEPVEESERIRNDLQWEDLKRFIGLLEKKEIINPRETACSFISLYGHGLISKWVTACILKDLQMGVSYTTANKIWPGLIQTFNVMLAEVGILADLKPPLILEPKLDGVRCTAIIKENDVTLLARSGNEIFLLDNVKASLKKLAPQGGVFDGELYSGSFQETMSAVRRSANLPSAALLEKTSFHAFDYLTLDEWENKSCGLSYAERRLRLSSLPFRDIKYAKLVPAFACTEPDDLTSTVQKHLNEGWEGSMGKDPFGLYVFGRSESWLKIKPVEEGDFLVLSTYEGNGKNKGMLGGLVIQLENGSTNQVGNGFSKEERILYWTEPDKIVGRVIMVEYKWRTPQGQLREPVFKRLREDKDASALGS